MSRSLRTAERRAPKTRFRPGGQARDIRYELCACVSPVLPASHQSCPRQLTVVNAGFRCRPELSRPQTKENFTGHSRPPPPGLGQLGNSTNCGVGSGNGGDGARRGAGHAAANGTRCEPARATWCYHGGEPEFWGARHGAGRRHARGVSLRRTWPASLAPSVAVACMPALTDNGCVRGIVAHAQLVQTGQRGGNEGGVGEAEAL